MNNIFSSVEFYISVFAVLLSAISLLYTYHKNRDSLEVIFYRPVTHTFEAKSKKLNGETKPVSMNEVFFTQIIVNNSSNHDIGYSNLFIKVDNLNTRAIFPTNEEDKIIVAIQQSLHTGNMIISDNKYNQSGVLKARSNNNLRVAVSNFSNSLDFDSDFKIHVTITINKSRFSNIFRRRKRRISNTVEVSHTFNSDELNFQMPPPELEQPIHKFL